MKGRSRGVAAREPRRDRYVQEREHDAYRQKGKLPEPAVCTQCEAVFQGGRWTWSARPPESHEGVCPACSRTNDKYPAGIVTISGDFLAEHRDEILNLAHNEEEKEKTLHPLHRIMKIDAENDGIVISTTDDHLPRRIGEALYNAYQGALDFHYVEDTKLIRVSWKR